MVITVSAAHDHPAKTYPQLLAEPFDHPLQDIRLGRMFTEKTCHVSSSAPVRSAPVRSKDPFTSIVYRCLPPRLLGEEKGQREYPWIFETGALKTLSVDAQRWDPHGRDWNAQQFPPWVGCSWYSPKWSLEKWDLVVWYHDAKHGLF